VDENGKMTWASLVVAGAITQRDDPGRAAGRETYVKNGKFSAAR